MSNFSTVEEAYQALGAAAIEFPKERSWDQVTAKYELLIGMVSLRCYLEHEGIRDGKGDGASDNIQHTSMDAAEYLRDELLRTTGERIWGLDFTLYPSGKFKLDYDYNRPEDAEDDDDEDAAPLSVDAAIADLSGLGVEVEVSPSAPSTDERAFFSAAMAKLQEQTRQNGTSWGLGEETQWNLDMHAGTIRFTFADGRVVQAPVQVVGTYNTQNGSFLWGWDHPSVPEPLRLAAKSVRDHGMSQGWGQFGGRELPCTEAEAWEFTAAAMLLTNAEGAYRGSAGDAWVYMTFSDPITHQP